MKPKKYIRKFGRKETRLFQNRTDSLLEGEADSGPNKENEGMSSKK